LQESYLTDHQRHLSQWVPGEAQMFSRYTSFVGNRDVSSLCTLSMPIKSKEGIVHTSVPVYTW
jgi:hypothetical protein